MHGGAVMALADNLGGTAAIANLPTTGGSTTTIESKTNFFAGIPEGDMAYAECTPLHRGRTTTVWQTRITRGDGKLAALVTQTQLMMTKPGGSGLGQRDRSCCAGGGALPLPWGEGRGEGVRSSDRPYPL